MSVQSQSLARIIHIINLPIMELKSVRTQSILELPDSVENEHPVSESRVIVQVISRVLVQIVI